MNEKRVFTKVLAIAGAVLVWFPLLAPVLLTLMFLLQTGEFRFDFLMPAELFLFALAGGVLLVWTAVREQLSYKLIVWALVAAVVLLVGSQAFAVVTGLASGETEMAGLVFVVVLAMLAAFTLSLIVLGIGGLLLLRNVFRGQRPLMHGA